MTDGRLVVAVAVVSVALLGSVVALVTALGPVEGAGPPIETECRYDPTDERLTFEVQRGSVTEAEFSGLWVYADDELASLSGPDGETDTGAWVIDGDVGDVASYPVDEGSTVTVHGVTPASEVYVTVAWEGGDADSLTAVASPVREDCSYVSAGG